MDRQKDSKVRTEKQLKAEIAALKKQVAELKAENAALRKQRAQLRMKVTRLEAELEASQRREKRQAAPFSKGEPKKDPKRPGRKRGGHYGRKAHRPSPQFERIDEFYDVPLPESCPQCGGQVDLTGVAQQYQVEIPRRPLYRQFNIQLGECRCCGRRIQGRHALQTSDALGAAASQLGPDAQAAIVFLNKQAGLSHGKITKLFADLFGITLSRGGSAQVVLRAARRCRSLAQKITASLRMSPWGVADETSWKIGGHPGWLHVLVGDQGTCYQIDPHRSADVTADVLGWDYGGTLIHDGLASYGRFKHAWHQQCARHLMRRVENLLANAVRGAVHFPRAVLALFLESLSLRDRYKSGELTDNDLADGYLSLSVALQELVERPRQNAANQRLAKHLRKHLTEWFWFLLEPHVDATNYRAEQALRPAVVNRKVWGGNRTPVGAEAQATLMTVLETCRRHKENIIDVCHRLFCGSSVILIDPP